MLLKPTCQAAFNGAAASQGRQTTVWTQFDSTGARLTGRRRHTAQPSHHILEPEVETESAELPVTAREEAINPRGGGGWFLPAHAGCGKHRCCTAKQRKLQRKTGNFLKKCLRHFILFFFFYLLTHGGHLNGPTFKRHFLSRGRAAHTIPTQCAHWSISPCVPTATQQQRLPTATLFW